jgi:signal transduction histidine kinase
MNRLVEQLLRVARLDAIALDVSGTADLNDIATSVVATMAPWALARDRMIAFSGPDKPVSVRGNAHAIADAIRNLVENATAHSPAWTEITVTTYPDGKVSVADRGPGVAARDRQLIFDRFWRGKGGQPQGAGLGLAIVKEIVKMHRGTVVVENGPNGGAVFTLCFPLAV